MPQQTVARAHPLARGFATHHGAGRPWRGVGYFRTRCALIRVSASLYGRIDPNAMAILDVRPDKIGAST